MNKKIKISINLAILFCAMTLGIIYSLDNKEYKQDISSAPVIVTKQAQANIFVNDIEEEKSEEEKSEGEIFLEEALVEKDIKSIEELAEVENIDSMFSDLADIDEMYAFDTDDTEKGIVLSFSGVVKGVIHPFYGFFEKEGGKITKLHWADGGKAKFIERSEGKIVLENTGIIPWNTKDKWENYVNFTPCTLESENGKEYVKIGEKGTFYFTEIKNERFMPQNLRHEYLIEVDMN